MASKKTENETPISENCPKDARQYDLSESYVKGEKIYHAVWEDLGEVEETGVTEDGCKKMLVRFEKNGKKKLIMEFVAK